MAKRKRVRAITWKHPKSPRRVLRPARSSPAVPPPQGVFPLEPASPAKDRHAVSFDHFHKAPHKKKSARSAGSVVRFRYQKPWAWDTHPVVFVLYATPSNKIGGFLEGFNIRYMNKKYWVALENFVNQNPKASPSLLYFMIRETHGGILTKAYRRYLYERINGKIEDYPLSLHRGRIRTKHMREGGMV